MVIARRGLEYQFGEAPIQWSPYWFGCVLLQNSSVLRDAFSRLTMPVRLLIADDHEIVRLGVRTLLAGELRWEVCGEAVDGKQALDKVVRLMPDVVLLDLSMPEMNGFEVAKHIRQMAPSTKIVFFSIHDTPATARHIGADGFVTKASAAKDLVATLERVVGLNRAPGS